jgi:hypothetical protein
MKKTKTSKKLQLNKYSVHNLSTRHVTGGISGATCGCPPPDFSLNTGFTACSKGDKLTRACPTDFIG